MTASFQELELRPTLRKSVFVLLASSGFLIGGLYVIHEGTVISLAMGLLGTGFGIVGIPVAVITRISKRMVLRLTPEGFGFGTLRKKYFYDWHVIAGFSVGSLSVGWAGQKKVCFTFRSDYQGEEKIRAINQKWMRVDRFLPDTYGKKPMELVTLLEEWRHRYAQS